VGEIRDKDEGDFHTVGLLEDLRTHSHELHRTIYDLFARVDGILREIANPNVPSLDAQLPFTIEMWNSTGNRIRLVAAGCTNLTIARGAYEAAITGYPQHNWALRKRMMLLQEHTA
jgi:hypothetical protein